jgi:hypothetical protein
MLAELAQVPDRRERWRFALGCVRAAVIPSRRRWALLLAAAAAAATAAATGVAVGRVQPDLRLFGVTFVGLVGALAVVAVSRVRRVHRPAAGLPIAATGSAGVAASIALVAYFRSDASVLIDRRASIGLAVALAIGVWLSVFPPRDLATSRRARVSGLGVGVGLAAGMLLTSRLLDGGIGPFLLLCPFPVLFAAAALVSATDRSVWAGLQTAVWGVLTTCQLSFAVYVVEAVRYGRSGLHPIDMDLMPGYTGTDLNEALAWVFAVLPLLTLPFAILGAVLGAVGTDPRGPASRTATTTP